MEINGYCPHLHPKQVKTRAYAVVMCQLRADPQGHHREVPALQGHLQEHHRARRVHRPADARWDFEVIVNVDVTPCMTEPSVDPLTLVVHNIDGERLRTAQAQVGPRPSTARSWLIVVQDMLSQLAAVQGIHLVASMDHINAPLCEMRLYMKSFCQRVQCGATSCLAASPLSGCTHPRTPTTLLRRLTTRVSTPRRGL